MTPQPATQEPGGEGSSSGASPLDGSKGEFALVAEHLTKHFGERVAFDQVSFEVGYFEVFGFSGPKDAGKTTTIRTLGTLLAQSLGSATRWVRPTSSRSKRGLPDN